MRIEEVRKGDLAERLRERHSEIEQTVLTRIYSVADPGGVRDPDYVTGLRTAVSAAIAYGIAALEDGGDRPAPVPVELLAQARRAAGSGVPIDAVLRRYVAGHALLGEFIIQEAEGAGGGRGPRLQEALRLEAASLDHLIGAVVAEYRSETESKARSSHQRRRERVRKLLAGELADAEELDYDLDAWHLGLIAAGPGSEQAIRDLAAGLDRRALLVRHRVETQWAWLGGARELTAAQLESLAGWGWPQEVRVAIGEPARGLPGWRLTHRQAAAALPIAERGATHPVRYADVALLASLVQDEILADSLRQLYLAPLESAPDGGAVLRQTLRAYFAAGRNLTSAAAALVVDRRTVASRLRVVEECVGRTLEECAVDLQMALRLDELSDRSGS
jgi:hypothetical protein